MGAFIGITFTLWVLAFVLFFGSTSDDCFDSDIAKIMLVLFFWPIGVPIAIIYGFVKLFKIAFPKKEKED
jgi:hypothetical protein